MSTSDLHALSLLHTERGDLLYRHLRRLLANASPAQLDAACLDVWRRSRRTLIAGHTDASRPAVSPWLTLLREAYLVAGAHLLRHPVAPQLPLEPEAAAAGHAAWLAIEPPPLGDRSGTGDLADVQNAPDAAEDVRRWRALGDAVLEAVFVLPLPHRAAILMHHDLMLPVADIATVLGESPQTVRSLVWTALLQLRCQVGAALGADAHG